MNDAPWHTAFIFDETDDIVDAWYKIFTNVLDDYAPRNYFKTKVAKSRQNPKKLWNLINNLTKSDVNDHTNIHQLKEDNKVYTDKQEITELLNTFFVIQPQELVYSILTDITGVSPQVASYSNLNPKIQFQIPYITADKIQKLLQSMPSCKATGLDGIAVRVFKVEAPSISTSLAYLINHCIDNKRFPSIWKSAKVTPIYKEQRSKEDMNNYRPISVLPLLSKLLEKHVHHAFYSYL